MSKVTYWTEKLNVLVSTLLCSATNMTTDDTQEGGEMKELTVLKPLRPSRRLRRVVGQRVVADYETRIRHGTEEFFACYEPAPRPGFFSGRYGTSERMPST
jgi:hypothetical protein